MATMNAAICVVRTLRFVYPTMRVGSFGLRSLSRNVGGMPGRAVGKKIGIQLTGPLTDGVLFKVNCFAQVALRKSAARGCN
jgi:hypothetical protein